MKVLGIETSCDDTGVCLIEAEGDFGATFAYTVLGYGLISQTAVHAEYGGVFPDLAKREHAKNLVPLLEKCLHQANLLTYRPTRSIVGGIGTILEREPELLEQLLPFLEKCEKPNIDAIAVTYGPGLPPALWVGVNFAKALSLVWGLPLVAVNHMEGHIVMSMIENVSQSSGRLAKFEFPLLSLLASGGHTELVVSNGFGAYELIGKTRDDAAGEAFDKVARMLGLPYPGGPAISRFAAEARKCDEATPHRISLPRPMLHEDNFDFSFSGLKTAVLRLVEAGSPDGGLTDEMKQEIAREFEEAVADVLVAKTLRAVDQYGANSVVMGGGVSANSYIRERLKQALTDEGEVAKLLICPPEFSTDNALMVALPGYFHALERDFADPLTLRAEPDLAFAEKA